MTTERKSRGMSFSGPMVLALLNTKPDVWPAEPLDPTKPFKWQTRRLISRQAPFQVGQLLYVREALRRDEHEFADGHHLTWYVADERLARSTTKDDFIHWRWKNRVLPAMYMPREAARLWLVVKGVREEPLQDIGWRETIAEGAAVYGGPTMPEQKFAPLWNSLHKKPDTRWADNPSVHVYEIMRTEQQGELNAGAE